jgi:hypothetical protein
MILSRCPDQLSLPFALWTREAVQQLLERECDIEVSVWTVGRYLRAWGLTPQKPVRRVYEQNPVAVRKWLEEEYPAIREWARAARGHIHWLDEMGLRSDHQAGRIVRATRGDPVFGTGQCFPCNMISSITNRGPLAFMVFRQRFTARVFLNFLGRLLRMTRKTRRKVFLIADGHPVHKARSVRRWLAEHAAHIRIFWLPSYSPELNLEGLHKQISELRQRLSSGQNTLSDDERVRLRIILQRESRLKASALFSDLDVVPYGCGFSCGVSVCSMTSGGMFFGIAIL